MQNIMADDKEISLYGDLSIEKRFLGKIGKQVIQNFNSEPETKDSAEFKKILDEHSKKEPGFLVKLGVKFLNLLGNVNNPEKVITTSQDTADSIKLMKKSSMGIGALSGTLNGLLHMSSMGTAFLSGTTIAGGLLFGGEVAILTTACLATIYSGGAMLSMKLNGENEDISEYANGILKRIIAKLPENYKEELKGEILYNWTHNSNIVSGPDSDFMKSKLLGKLDELVPTRNSNPYYNKNI